MKIFWLQVRILLQKELTIESRKKERISLIFFFNLLALAVFGLSIQVEPAIQIKLLPGILWATIAFAGTLGMGRLFASELEENALKALQVAPIYREAIFLAKQFSLFLFLLLSSIVSIPLACWMFQVDFFAFIPKAWHFLLLGLWGFSILGTFVSTLLLKSRMRELFLPILFFPLVLPLLIAGSKATAEAMGVAGVPQGHFWWRAMFLFDLFFFLLCLWMYPIPFDS